MEAERRRYDTDYIRTSYMEGNTVRKLKTTAGVRREEKVYEVPNRQREPRVRPRAFSGVNFTSLLVLTAAITATVFVCVEYLKVQTEVSGMEKRIVSMERELTSLTNKNDAVYASIHKTYDLDYVYQVAVEELGMVYPNNNKLITYQKRDIDYVRQYEDIPR